MSRFEGGDRSMDPSAGDPIRIAARSSIVDSFKSCGLSGIRIDKEDLKRRLLMPDHLRRAMREAIRSKDPSLAAVGLPSPDPPPEAPEAPMVVFVNSRSGGRYGSVLKGRLQDLMGEEQVRLGFQFLRNLIRSLSLFFF